jgi:hypothetical protein
METTDLITQPAVSANKFVEQRRIHRLNGICDLMVEYGVTVEEIEHHFLYVYSPRSAQTAKKRQKQAQAPIRQQRAINAIRTRWDKHEAMKTSHLVRKQELLNRTASVPKPSGLTDIVAPATVNISGLSEEVS